MRELLTQAHRLHQAGNFAEAERLYETALRTNRAQFDALFPLGILRFQAGKYDEAEQLIGEAIRINPQIAEAHFMLGCVLQRLNRIEDAFAAFSRAVVNNPRYVEALANRGASLMALGRHAEALKDFDAVLAANPSIAGIWSNRGCILQNLGRHDEAVVCFDRALGLNPNLVEALANKGAALAVLRRFADAAAAFEKLVSVSPEHPYAHGYMAFYRLQCCDWRHLSQHRAAIAAGLAAGKRIVQPFINVTLSRSPADQLQCARVFAGDWPASSAPLWRGEAFVHDKIRLAYLSADFRTHATAVLMAGVFEHHDRSRFEVAAISTSVDDNSPMRVRLEAAFDRFIDVRRLDDRQSAAKIREMEIDIVVDLKGYTGDARPGILAHRPAPIQTHYLGYPGTMGVDYIDYIIADKIVIPAEHKRFYTEQIVTLPHSYQCNDSNRQIAEYTPTRAAAGLPDRGFVFCCFNNVSKITPEIFELWMRLLKDVDGSVLWLLEANNDATRNLKREAETRSVSSERLIFAPLTNLPDHLARHRLADLFLDTLPYGAHTTASDALWAGLPLLTCLGTTFPGRVGASLLQALGLPELIAESLADYERLALAFARDAPALAALKAKLARNRESEPLFDTKRFTRALEAAFAHMHDRHKNSLPPMHFAVPEG